MFRHTLLLVTIATAAQIVQSASLGDSIPVALGSKTGATLDLDYNLATSIVIHDPSRVKNIHTAISEVDVEEGITTRGAKEIALFKKVAPSVALIVSEDGTGTGSVINSEGDILTNWHVIKGNSYVDVIYKPVNAVDDDLLSPSVRAKIIRIDEIADLALLQPIKPDRKRAPLRLAQQGAIPVGTDTHAIGHPLGYTWTYTQGIVSQYREKQNWNYDLGYQHMASVVQTQTPINPGNSGGPLLNDAGEIIGVNSYRSSGESVNFAVSVADVRRFLAATSDRKAPKIPGTPAMQDFSTDCQAEALEQYESSDGKATIVTYDLSCDGDVNSFAYVPHDTSEPIEMLFDTTGDGNVDVRLVDTDRNDVWDISFYDLDGDEEPDLVGYHDEESLPYEFVSYARFQKLLQG